MDVKPYGYRVGGKEVRSVFAPELPEAEEGRDEGHWAFWSSRVGLDQEKKASQSPRRRSVEDADKTSAIVALQRYPIIPYNPPGPGVPAHEEIFPKVSQ